MTIKDFSNGFDTLLNSYAATASFGKTDNPVSIELDEYEKSMFLTDSQEEIVLGLYTGKNTSGESFEQTEELRRYLAPLIKEEVLDPITTTNGQPLGFDSKSKFFTLPEDLWFITYEAVAVEGGKCQEGFSMMVIPVRQDEYHRIKKNPFRGANDRRSLRLDLSDNNIEIVSKYTVTQYYVRYLKKLTPIVLGNFKADGLTVRGVGIPTECELHESLHQKILERAVMMAVRSKGLIENNNNENR